MSCWVVPSVAAELWGIPVSQVIQAMEAGRVPTRTELGFTLVDVAPTSPQITAPRRDPADRPVTFATAKRVARPNPAPELVPAEADDADDEAFDWRVARRETARLRRRPMAMAA